MKELTQMSIGKTLYKGDFDWVDRDAVHFAVVPVFVDENLKSGQRVAFVDGSTEKVKASATYNDAIGIIDPFLEYGAHKGERVWLFLLPNTITGLRHVWTHPAFGDALEKNSSQAWIDAFAAELDQTPSRLMDAANTYVECGEYTYDNSEVYKRVDYAKWTIFWKHYEIVTGRKVEEKDAHPYTCSC